MKVWLDDERDPTAKNIKNNFGADGDEVWVKTAEEAIVLLVKGVVTSISLDHDLGLDSVGDGMTVALFIEQGAYNGTLSKLAWKVHSFNPVGAKNMRWALERADEYWAKGWTPALEVQGADKCCPP